MLDCLLTIQMFLYLAKPCLMFTWNLMAQLNNWFTANKLSLNINKTCYSAFGRRSSDSFIKTVVRNNSMDSNRMEIWHPFYCQVMSRSTFRKLTVHFQLRPKPHHVWKFWECWLMNNKESASTRKIQLSHTAQTASGYSRFSCFCRAHGHEWPTETDHATCDMQ